MNQLRRSIWSNCVAPATRLFTHALPETFHSNPTRILNRAALFPKYYHPEAPKDPRFMYATTILCVRRGDKVVIIGDGQVTQGSFVVKDNARKVRRLQNGQVITGFAGSAVDAIALFERLEGKLEQYPQLMRACVELAKEWRSDKYLRRMLNAVLVVADKEISLTLSGNGDVLETANGVIGIGSGGIYAQCAATALIDVPDLTAEEIARRAMKVASDTCIYTNHNYVIETLDISTAPAQETTAPAQETK
jgi:ATP-dependent HslUV protease subunit HslV